MCVALLVVAGVVVLATLAVIGYMCVGNRADNEAAVQRLLVRREQQLGEARMLRTAQDAVEQMFKAVRDHR